MLSSCTGSLASDYRESSGQLNRLTQAYKYQSILGFLIYLRNAKHSSIENQSRYSQNIEVIKKNFFFLHVPCVFTAKLCF